MGIYDRDYYREGTRSAMDGRVQAFVVLIGIYVAVYILQIATREETGVRQLKPGPVTEAITLNADKVLQGEVWRVVTYAFAHDPLNPAPIAFNIIFLIFFGKFVEDLYGWKEFLTFYLISGILAGIGFVCIAGVAQVNAELIGPQATITAVLLLVALQNPKRTVLLLFVIPCPIWFVVAFNVLLDAIGYFGGKIHPLVFAAHGCAAAFSFAYYRRQWKVSNWLPSLAMGKGRAKSRPKLQIYRDEGLDSDAAHAPATAGNLPMSSSAASPSASPATATATAVMDEQLEAKLDEVLDKVKRFGQESLSEEERAVLFRASEIYRKRRKS